MVRLAFEKITRSHHGEVIKALHGGEAQRERLAVLQVKESKRYWLLTLGSRNPTNECLVFGVAY